MTRATHDDRAACPNVSRAPLAVVLQADVCVCGHLEQTHVDDDLGRAGCRMFGCSCSAFVSEIAA